MFYIEDFSKKTSAHLKKLKSTVIIFSMKKIAVITGASSGMGREFAIQIARDWQNLNLDEIWILARRSEKLEETKNEIVKIKGSPKVICTPIDVNGKQGAVNFKTLLETRFQEENFEIKVLINNAGFGTYGPFEETPVEKEMEMVELNCTSLTGTTGYALPYIKEHSFIINTASLAAFSPLGNFAVYGATKAYVLSFSIALASELKHRKISVMALCPGSVSTEFANVASNGARKEVLHGIGPEKVIAHCLKRAFRGKLTAVYRFKWKCSAFFSRFAGRYFVADYMYKNCKRPYRHEN